MNPSVTKAFRTSLLARRFPGLKELSDKDIQDIVLDNSATLQLDITQKTYPKTNLPQITLVKSEPDVWNPCNPQQAKYMSSKKPHETYVAIYSPYAAEHEDFLHNETIDRQKNGWRGIVQPNIISGGEKYCQSEVLYQFGR
eukprot:TRINITY_DN4005_c0_g1_i1.p3 TRINITY_DN4005_c0_g1~~TRINITY_DN4005_c0_g1_i1.p3  ORF type:complete len:141 (+),score=1.31 TRINITY_DN4005_c0_g1_i1:267-689(+)